MQSEPGAQSAALEDDARLEALGYKPQLNRALGFFANFAVAFTYLSPMVGIYSLFVLALYVLLIPRSPYGPTSRSIWLTIAV